MGASPQGLADWFGVLQIVGTAGAVVIALYVKGQIAEKKSELLERLAADYYTKAEIRERVDGLIERIGKEAASVKAAHQRLDALEKEQADLAHRLAGSRRGR